MIRITLCFIAIVFVSICQARRRCEGTAYTTRFFNVSDHIYTTIQNPNDYGKVLDRSSNSKNSSININVIWTNIELSRTCKFYTEIMTYKYKLSHLVFNDPALNSAYATKLTQLMIDLQTAANLLQKMKMASSHLTCIEFTASQYEQIYRSYDGNRMDVLRSLKDSADNWSNRFMNQCALVNDTK